MLRKQDDDCFEHESQLSKVPSSIAECPENKNVGLRKGVKPGNAGNLITMINRVINYYRNGKLTSTTI